MEFIEKIIQEKRVLRQSYLRQKATEAGFDSVDEYIESLRTQQIELQPLTIPNDSNVKNNPWFWVANNYELSSKWKK